MDALIYFVSYFLTLSGFLLAKSTKEEHKEIVIFMRNTIYGLIVIYYLGLIYILFSNQVVSIVLFSILLAFLFFRKNNAFNKIHNLILFGSSFFLIIDSKFPYLFLIIIFVLFFNKSFQNFSLKEEIYNLIVLLVIMIAFDLGIQFL